MSAADDAFAEAMLTGVPLSQAHAAAGLTGQEAWRVVNARGWTLDASGRVPRSQRSTMPRSAGPTARERAAAEAAGTPLPERGQHEPPSAVQPPVRPARRGGARGPVRTFPGPGPTPTPDTPSVTVTEPDPGPVTPEPAPEPAPAPVTATAHPCCDGTHPDLPPVPRPLASWPVERVLDLAELHPDEAVRRAAHLVRADLVDLLDLLEERDTAWRSYLTARQGAPA